jgi:hypothetical protein
VEPYRFYLFILKNNQRTLFIWIILLMKDIVLNYLVERRKFEIGVDNCLIMLSSNGFVEHMKKVGLNATCCFMVEFLDLFLKH